MQGKSQLTQGRLKQLLHYDPLTGVFTRRMPSGNAHVGDIAGWRMPINYWGINLSGRQYYAHRLAWLYVYGEWPRDQIDHINGNKTDNRIRNLREANDQQNRRNMGLPRTNTSGFKGVVWFRRDSRWRAQIMLAKKGIHIGYFDTKEEASAAYEAKAEEIFGKFKRPQHAY